jgi:FtsK/SpoIIIE family
MRYEDYNDDNERWNEEDTELETEPEEEAVEAQERPETEEGLSPRTKALIFGGTLVPGLLIDLATQGGIMGAGISLILAYGLSRHSGDVLEAVGGTLPRPRPATYSPHTRPKEHRSKRSLSDRFLGRYPAEEANTGDEDTVIVDETSLLNEEEGLFSQTARREVPGVSRLTVEQIVRHVIPNSYSLYIGRSLTRETERYPAVRISFFKRHLKLIGASQKGKSSMAAALLDIITRTHDPQHVLIALLDLEDQTSKLFAHLPHVAEVLVGEEPIRLHARSREQVLEQLGYVLSIMESRYSLSKLELAEQPILLVYVEEFLALKDYFKRRIDSVRSGERDQAKADYAQLIFAISELARRGLKARVQLLLCAQVDYRDEDLQEALINITAGMSFAVRVTAAQAAGFYHVDLLKRNAIDNTIGQAVIETPDCTDLVLAPEYDLEQRLLAFEQAEMEQERRQHRRSAMAAPLQLRAIPNEQGAWEAIPSADQSSRRVTMPPLQPVAPKDVQPMRQPEPTLLERGVMAYLDGATSQPKLAVALKISAWDARKLMPEVEAAIKRLQANEQ